MVENLWSSLHIILSLHFLNCVTLHQQGEVSYHSTKTSGDLFLEFGRVPQWNCPIAGKHDESGPSRRPTPKPAQKSATAWFVPPIQVSDVEGFDHPTITGSGFSHITR